MIKDSFLLTNFFDIIKNRRSQKNYLHIRFSTKTDEVDHRRSQGGLGPSLSFEKNLLIIVLKLKKKKKKKKEELFFFFEKQK